LSLILPSKRSRYGHTTTLRCQLAGTQTCRLFGFLILIESFDLPCAMERRRLRRVVRLAMKSAIEGGGSLAMRRLVGSAWPKKRSQ